MQKCPQSNMVHIKILDCLIYVERDLLTADHGSRLASVFSQRDISKFELGIDVRCTDVSVDVRNSFGQWVDALKTVSDDGRSISKLFPLFRIVSHCCNHNKLLLNLA